MGKRGAIALPAWRSGKGWQVIISGAYVPLGVSDPADRESAYMAWHRLMAGVPGPGGPPGPAAPAPSAPAVSGPRLLLSTLMARWLAAREAEVAASTMRGYRFRVTPLVSVLGDREVEGLTPAAVSKALENPRWSASFRGDMLRMLKPAIRWALAERLIDADPVGDMRGGASGVRRVPDYTRAAHEKLLAVCRPRLADIVAFLRATGCRPGEARAATVGEVDIEAGVVRLEKHKTAKKTGRQRSIVLPEAVRARVREMCVGREAGARLLVNEQRKPWLKDSLSGSLRRACARAGIPAVTPYSFRHLFVTDALVAGVPIATVAALVGHTSTAMIARVYSHLTDRIDHLREQADRVHGG